MSANTKAMLANMMETSASTMVMLVSTTETLANTKGSSDCKKDWSANSSAT